MAASEVDDSNKNTTEKGQPSAQPTDDEVVVDVSSDGDAKKGATEKKGNAYFVCHMMML